MTQQWIPTLGQLNLAPVPAVLRPPPFFWQEVEDQEEACSAARARGDLLAQAWGRQVVDPGPPQARETPK